MHVIKLKDMMDLKSKSVHRLLLSTWNPMCVCVKEVLHLSGRPITPIIPPLRPLATPILLATSRRDLFIFFGIFTLPEMPLGYYFLNAKTCSANDIS